MILFAISDIWTNRIDKHCWGHEYVKFPIIHEQDPVIPPALHGSFLELIPRGIATSSYPKRYEDIILGICVIILDHTVGI